jgi:hypothetical protein
MLAVAVAGLLLLFPETHRFGVDFEILSLRLGAVLAGGVFGYLYFADSKPPT